MILVLLDCTGCHVPRVEANGVRYMEVPPRSTESIDMSSK